MTKDQMAEFFKQNEIDAAEFTGKCHDCKTDVAVEVAQVDDDFDTTGGAIYKTDSGDFLKCELCYVKNKRLTHFAPTEVYSRPIGYLRPVTNCHKAKQREINDRVMFDISDMDPKE